jgi:hypothetical protein
MKVHTRADFCDAALRRGERGRFNQNFRTMQPKRTFNWASPAELRLRVRSGPGAQPTHRQTLIAQSAGLLGSTNDAALMILIYSASPGPAWAR